MFICYEYLTLKKEGHFFSSVLLLDRFKDRPLALNLVTADAKDWTDKRGRNAHYTNWGRDRNAREMFVRKNTAKKTFVRETF